MPATIPTWVQGAHLETLHTDGYVVVSGLLTDAQLDALDAETWELQERLISGDLGERHGTSLLVDPTVTDVRPNYVTHTTEISPLIRSAVLGLEDLARQWLGPCWLLEGDPFGVVFQDTRAGKESSYTRIGWHSDWQSYPHIPSKWPSLAFTIHLDATSPANGFLRVVPGSHRWATPAPYDNVNGFTVPEGAQTTGGYDAQPPPAPMPLRFEKVPGEVAAYCERGDVLFHDAYLWHSAARATDDDGIRRHLRGGWYSGLPEDGSATEADFVKNAAR